MDKTNLAFKCNFCNGGRTNTNYGYNGVCSKDVIAHNIMKAKYDWCTQPTCDCNRYYKNEISYEDLQEIYNKNGSVCYESSMLNTWTALAGWDNNGEHAGRRRTIRNAELGSLAVLTLVTPNDEESNRRIFALFIIGEYFEGGMDAANDEVEGFVACNSKYKLNFTKRETNELRFWYYYNNENTPKCRWGSGLFRYLTDEQSAQILKQAARVKKGTDEEGLATEIFEYYCREHGILISQISEPSGSKLVPTDSVF